MTLIQAIVYGIVQGLTEFLPVSSSGHLALAQIILGAGNPEELISFNVLLHLGTFIAVCIVYFKDIIALIPAIFTAISKLFHKKFKFSDYSYNERFVILLVIATLPLFVAALIEDKLAFISSYLSIIGAILIFNGFMLWFSDRLTNGKTDIDTLKPKKALFIGLFQALAALLPGLSRSGSTITGGLLAGFSRKSAVKFSFILSLPAIAGACILKVPDLFTTAESNEQMLIYLAGAVAAAVVGILAMKILTYISVKSNFKVFAIYCAIIGSAAIIYDIII